MRKKVLEAAGKGEQKCRRRISLIHVLHPDLEKINGSKRNNVMLRTVFNSNN